ncbi:hypothetical protein GNY06_03865 [Elizabethkingia argentiflava]|uniref:Transposase n=1 Tax=Elizabethkingia argenteiflava TaxID=2681556 RepID=A0A845PQI4_9FLAO|nr:hypothetical protein [Elizabethkingia argenteiflava]NAW50559.1 hypothetical protein [Elizabethkingia argenteiflava]
MAQEEFDFESFKNEAIAGLYSGKKMTGTDGVLAPMVKHFLESMMSGELEYHLAQDKLKSRLTVRTVKRRRLCVV